MVAEVKHAKEVLRPSVVRDIAEARAHGDISENSEYEDAKDRQALLEGRIRMLEGQLGASEIIDVTKMPREGRVVFGTTVTLLNTETEEEVVYKVVGDYESDVKAGRISYTSPIGRALIGKSEGDDVAFTTPSGTRKYEVLAVNYR